MEPKLPSLPSATWLDECLLAARSQNRVTGVRFGRSGDPLCARADEALREALEGLNGLDGLLQVYTVDIDPGSKLSREHGCSTPLMWTWNNEFCIAKICREGTATCACKLAKSLMLGCKSNVDCADVTAVPFVSIPVSFPILAFPACVSIDRLESTGLPVPPEDCGWLSLWPDGEFRTYLSSEVTEKILRW